MARRRFRLAIPDIATGMASAFRGGYDLSCLRRDILAGLTVGTVAIPLSMALAIATGVPPQHGLYTAIVAGALIALAGGSRFNVSGPTAAFVVILLPIVQQFGLRGLMIASMMAGIILIALGLARMGRLLQFIPYPVILGFTSGIALVIAVLQIPDFLGLTVQGQTGHFLEHLSGIITALPTANPAELGIGMFTLLTILLWPKTKLPVPSPLAGLMAGALAAIAISHWLPGLELATIDSRFQWELNGISGTGIPAAAPQFVWPWLQQGGDAAGASVDFALIHALLGPAFAIAILCAIESLLCAVIADGLTNTRHNPNAELIGQGLGNIVAPLFGGITATAALARTATSIRSGAHSPIAAVVHALVVLLAVLWLSDLLGFVPMSSLAALLLVVAWNMSESRHFMQTLRSAPPGDIAILVTCFGLTVLFDMVLAVAVGVGLASALFIRRMAQLTQTQRLHAEQDPAVADLPEDVALYDINGPLFFAAAEKALTSLRLVDPGVSTIIVDMRDVPSMDGTAIVALQTLTREMQHQKIGLILVGLPTRIIVKLRRAGIVKRGGILTYCQNLRMAKATALRWKNRPAP